MAAATTNLVVCEMPIKKVRGGYKVVSYVSGKTLKKTYKTRSAAEKASATSRRRSQRKRSTGAKRRGY